MTFDSSARSLVADVAPEWFSPCRSGRTTIAHAETPAKHGLPIPKPKIEICFEESEQARWEDEGGANVEIIVPESGDEPEGE